MFDDDENPLTGMTQPMKDAVWHMQNPGNPRAHAPLELNSTGSGSAASDGAGMGKYGSLFGLGMDGLNAGFGLYSGLKQLGLADKEFKLNRAITEGNYNNEAKQYNTNLRNTANLRSSYEGTPQASADSYYNQNKLSGV